MERKDVINTSIAVAGGFAGGLGTKAVASTLFALEGPLGPLIIGVVVGCTLFYSGNKNQWGETTDKAVSNVLGLENKTCAIIAISAKQQELSEDLKSEGITLKTTPKLLEERILVAACSQEDWKKQKQLIEKPSSDNEGLLVYLVKFELDDAGEYFGKNSNVMIMSDILKKLEDKGKEEQKIEVSKSVSLSKLLSGIFYKV